MHMVCLYASRKTILGLLEWSTIAILLILNTCKMYTMMSSWYDITEVVIPSPLDFGIHISNKPSDFGVDHQPLARPSDYGLTIRLWGDNRTWSLTCINVNLWLFHVLVNWFTLHGCFGGGFFLLDKMMLMYIFPLMTKHNSLRLMHDSQFW